MLIKTALLVTLYSVSCNVERDDIASPNHRFIQKQQPKKPEKPLVFKYTHDQKKAPNTTTGPDNNPNPDPVTDNTPDLDTAPAADPEPDPDSNTNTEPDNNTSPDYNDDTPPSPSPDSDNDTPDNPPVTLTPESLCTNNSNTQTWEDKIIICNADQLAAIANDPSADYALGQDIETHNTWTPIGNADTPFLGTLDGRNHKILNLNLDSSDKNLNGGLFYQLGNANKQAEIKNLILGTNNSTTIYHNTSNSPTSRIGTLAYLIENAYLENIQNHYSINNAMHAGGIAANIIGNLRTKTIKSTADISAKYTGGLFGKIYNYNNIDITDTLSSGSIQGKYFAGGLIGSAESNSESELNITNFKNQSNITSDSEAGGIVGSIQGQGASVIKNTLNNATISGLYAASVIGKADNVNSISIDTAENANTINGTISSGFISTILNSKTLILKNINNTGTINGPGLINRANVTHISITYFKNSGTLQNYILGDFSCSDNSSTIELINILPTSTPNNLQIAKYEPSCNAPSPNNDPDPIPPAWPWNNPTFPWND